MSMRIELLGGFGEKGRTSIAVEAGRGRAVFDLGIKVGAVGADYYPRINGPVDGIAAVFISHAHEDHVGALPRLAARGYSGPVFMTAETAAEAPATLAAYAGAEDVRAFPLERMRIEIFRPGDRLEAAGLDIATGMSGHVVGGVWFAITGGDRRVVYSADVVPDSAVFRMDPVPECDLIILDASYGADPVSGPERAAAIAEWIAARPGGCLLPTPLSGRSLELIAAMPGGFAIHHTMRGALERQIDAGVALRPGMAALLSDRLSAARDWRDREDLPRSPLLCDDGMGRAGPSATLIPRAAEAGYPVLFTGHLPAGTPGQELRDAGGADWIRMPTHPTLSGNLAIWEGAGRPPALGHSCPAADLDALASHIPALMRPVTGQRIEVEKGRARCAS